MDGQVELLKELVKDCMEALELFTDHIVAGTEINDPDKAGFAIMSNLTERFRAIDPDWTGVLPLETPVKAETTEELIKRLSGENQS